MKNISLVNKNIIKNVNHMLIGGGGGLKNLIK